jgi:peptidoglycan/LPS O-acetylase OafA/YrhL
VADRATPPYRGLPYVAGLDGVRAIAVAGVLLYHGGVAKFSGGFLGVDVFFVLSGFLITSLLLSERTRRGHINLAAFWLRRARRLLPAAFLVVGVCTLVVAVFYPSLLPRARGDAIASFFYVNNWHQAFAHESYFAALGRPPMLQHLWSLAVEEQFYLVWPTVVLLAGRKRLWPICLAIIAGATALRFKWAYDGVPWNQIYRLTITRADTMAWGALGALALRSPAWRTRAARLAPAVILAGTAAFLAVALYAGGPDWARRPIQTAGAAVAAFGFLGLVVYAATARTGAVHALLRRPLLLSLGKYSYFIYVVHGLVISHVYWIGEAVIKRKPGLAIPLKLTLFVATSVAVFLLAKLSFRFFEAPILRLKKRFD